MYFHVLARLWQLKKLGLVNAVFDYKLLGDKLVNTVFDYKLFGDRFAKSRRSDVANVQQQFWPL